MLCLFLGIFLLSSACTVWAGDTEGLTWYVAKNGSDAWSGRLPTPNTTRTDGPFATLARARNEIRDQRRHIRKEAGVGGYHVLVRGGVYYLARPLILSASDSGTRTMPVTYEAYPGEKVEIKGSRIIRGWKPYRGRIYQADLSSTDIGKNRFWQLFYKGKRQILARYPNFDPRHPLSGGFLYLTATIDAKTHAPLMHPPKDIKTVSRDVLQYNPKRLNPARWSKPNEVRVHIWPWLNWNMNVIKVKSFDVGKHLLLLQRPASYALIKGNRFFVDNAREDLDAPGEWYYDEGSKQLLFWPPDGKNPEGYVSVAVLPALVEIKGDEEKNEFVRYVTLRGFRLSESANTLVSLRMAAHCTIAACSLTWCGGTAIEVTGRSRHNRIVGCDIAHTGGSGIALNGVRDWTHSLEGRISYNMICNNHIHHTGELKSSEGAIVISPSCGGNVTHDNVISHNLIHDTPHQGIRFEGFRNVVEYNDIHHTNQEYSDSGGIGMCSRDIQERGSIIRYNFIHDTGGYSMTSPGVWRYPHFTWGIYLDGYTSGVRVYGNVITRAPRGGIKIHGGQDNIVENNVIVNCGKQQIEYDPIDRLRMGTPGRNPANQVKTLWLMTGTRVIRNIFSYEDRDAYWIASRLPKWKQMIAESDRNLIWHHGRPVTVGLTSRNTGVKTWIQWKKMGYDVHSIISDPLFVDPSHDDYRLQPGSPAFKLGFEPIPMQRIGLFKSPDRASWPPKGTTFRQENRLSRPGAGWYGRIRGWLRDEAVRLTHLIRQNIL